MGEDVAASYEGVGSSGDELGARLGIDPAVDLDEGA